MRSPYTALIRAAALDQSVDADVLEALVLVESNGHADAFRFEPQFAQRYHVATHPVFKAWPERAVASSYGLCQLMFPTAYNIGFRGEPEELFIPTTNLAWGAHYLALCFAWSAGFNQNEARTLQGALCAYNGGRNSQTSPLNSRPPNIGYAERIKAALASLMQGG